MFTHWLSKIKNKVIIFSLFISVLPLMLLGYINIQSSKENIMQTIHEHNMGAARVIANELTLFIEHTTERIQMIIEAYDPLVNTSIETQELVIYSLMKDMPEIEQVAIFDANRRPLSIVSKRDIIELKEAVCQTDITRDIIFEAIYYENDGRPILNTIIPIWDQVTDTPLGVMKAHINLRSFIQNATETDMNGYYFVVDSFGNLIGHQDFSEVLSNRYVKGSLAVENILNGISPYAVTQPLTYKTYDNTKVLGSYAIIPRLDWGVVIEQPLQDALQPVNKLYLRFILATFIVSLSVAIISVIYAVRFTKPIEDLSKGATIVASGQLDYQIETKADGEIAELIDSFNHMTTELRIKTADLVQEKQLLDKVVGGVGVGLALINDDCSLVWCNQQLYRWFQTDNQNEVAKHIDISVDKCTIDDYEYTLAINNNKMHLRQRVFPLEKRHADDPRYLRLIEDITAKREMEAMVIQADKLAAVGLLASGVAHEINNPLHTINLYTEFVAEELLTFRDRIELEQDRQRFDNIINDLETVKKQVIRCSNITSSLLNFSRQRDMTNETVDINALIRETISLLTYSIQRADIIARLQLEDNLPYIECSPIHLQQVFFNLIQNAIDAIEMNNTHNGNSKQTDGKNLITISTEIIENHLVISFADTGQGISENDLKKLFDPFYTTKEVGKGTGLGLSISYGIISQMHGTITVDSELGVGTTFAIKLNYEG